MQYFEYNYANLVDLILLVGNKREGRNGGTLSLFGQQLKVTVENNFPLLQGRKMYPAGVLGEFAALVRQPKHIDDFTKWGCNYWDKWANEDGSINVDYGNAWFDFNGFDQVADLKDKLANNPTDRRMIINSWRPDRLADLSLPCCHYTYQFYVKNFGSSRKLNMVWIQRSVDMMIGLPSDIILGAVWLISLAREFGMTPGEITFQLGDCHIYNEHIEGANEYLSRVRAYSSMPPVKYQYRQAVGTPFELFEPSMLELINYKHASAIPFELKG